MNLPNIFPFHAHDNRTQYPKCLNQAPNVNVLVEVEANQLNR